jgi:hypothetical protein
MYMDKMSANSSIYPSGKMEGDTYLGKYVPGAFSAVYNISGYKYKGILAIRTNF